MRQLKICSTMFLPGLKPASSSASSSSAVVLMRFCAIFSLTFLGRLIRHMVLQFWHCSPFIAVERSMIIVRPFSGPFFTFLDSKQWGPLLSCLHPVWIAGMLSLPIFLQVANFEVLLSYFGHKDVRYRWLLLPWRFPQHWGRPASPNESEFSGCFKGVSFLTFYEMVIVAVLVRPGYVLILDSLMLDLKRLGIRMKSIWLLTNHLASTQSLQRCRM